MVDDEQWSNFMHQVQNITKLVSDLTSNDEEKSQKAMVLSDKYLSEGTLNETEAVRIKNNRTVINHQAFEIEDRPTNPVSIFKYLNL